MSLFDPDEGGDDAPPSPEKPILPYAGTSGWSGSDTSRERAEHADTSGVTGANQQRVMSLLWNLRSHGATWGEVATQFDWHHGIASGALSGLHKEGFVARLTERRGRSQVYVRPEFVGDRETAPYTPNTQKASDVLAQRLADLFLEYLDQRADLAAQMATWQKMLRIADEYRAEAS